MRVFAAQAGNDVAIAASAAAVVAALASALGRPAHLFVLLSYRLLSSAASGRRLQSTSALLLEVRVAIFSATTATGTPGLDDPLVAELSDRLRSRSLRLGYPIEWSQASVSEVDGAATLLQPPSPPAPAPSPVIVVTNARVVEVPESSSLDWVTPVVVAAACFWLCFCTLVVMSTRSIGFWCRVCCPCKRRDDSKKHPVMVGVLEMDQAQGSLPPDRYQGAGGRLPKLVDRDLGPNGDAEVDLFTRKPLPAIGAAPDGATGAAGIEEEVLPPAVRSGRVDPKPPPDGGASAEHMPRSGSRSRIHAATPPANAWYSSDSLPSHS